MKLVKAAAADFLKFFYSFTLKHCLKLSKIVPLSNIALITELSACFIERRLFRAQAFCSARFSERRLFRAHAFSERTLLGNDTY